MLRHSYCNNITLVLLKLIIILYIDKKNIAYLQDQKQNFVTNPCTCSPYKWKMLRGECSELCLKGQSKLGQKDRFLFCLWQLRNKTWTKTEITCISSLEILQCNTIRNVRRISKLISGLIKSVDHRIGGKTSDAVAAFHVEAGKSLTTYILYFRDSVTQAHTEDI